MLRRKGIGATAASAVVFSVILLCNITLVSASNERETLYKQADAENLLNDQSIALGATGGMRILYDLQTALGSSIFECSIADQSVKKMVSQLGVVQTAGRVTVSVSAAMASGEVSSRDSFLAPFDGSVPGDLDLSLNATSVGSSSVGVSLRSSALVPAHLPARFQKEVVDCLVGIGLVVGVVGKQIPGNCNKSVVAPLFSSGSRYVASLAAADGFGYGLTYSISQNSPCTVGFTLLIKQMGIPGPGGPFSIQMQQKSSITYGQQASSPPSQIGKYTFP